MSGRIMVAVAIIWIARILTWMIIIDAILTFFPAIDRRNPLVVLLRSITEPMYRPLRKLIPPIQTGNVGFDLSPLILIIGIQILAQVIAQIIMRT